MKKRFKVFVVFLMVVCTLLRGVPFGTAATLPVPIEPLYELTLVIKASCTVSSGVASCYGYVKASSSTSNVNLTVTLYRQSGESWNRVSSWSLSNQGQCGEIDENCSVGSGTYKVVASGTVVAQNGRTETVYRTSALAVY